MARTGSNIKARERYGVERRVNVEHAASRGHAGSSPAWRQCERAHRHAKHPLHAPCRRAGAIRAQEPASSRRRPRPRGGRARRTSRLPAATIKKKTKRDKLTHYLVASAPSTAPPRTYVERGCTRSSARPINSSQRSPSSSSRSRPPRRWACIIMQRSRPWCTIDRRSFQ